MVVVRVSNYPRGYNYIIRIGSLLLQNIVYSLCNGVVFTVISKPFTAVNNNKASVRNSDNVTERGFRAVYILKPVKGKNNGKISVGLFILGHFSRGKNRCRSRRCRYVHTPYRRVKLYIYLRSKRKIGGKIIFNRIA